MATATFVETTVNSSNPLARFDESSSTEQWSMGADSADSGKFKVCNSSDLSGTCAVEFDGTDATFGNDVTVNNDLTVLGTITGNVNVSLENPIVSGVITSLGTNDITLNACDLNLAAMDGRVIDSISGDGATVTVDLTPTSSIEGNTTTAWGIPTAMVNVNLQGTGNASVDNVVFNATIVSASQFTFSSAETVFAASDPYVFTVPADSAVDGCGLFLRAENGGSNADKTLTYDNAADQWNSNIGVNFTDNTDVISFNDVQRLSNTEVGALANDMTTVYTEQIGRSGTNGTLSVGNSTTGNVEIASGASGLGGGDITLNSTAGSGGDVTATGEGITLTTTTGDLTATGEGNVFVTANNTNIGLTANSGQVNATAGTTASITAGTDNVMQMSGTQTTFNDDNNDVIFQVQGQTNDNMIHVDPTAFTDTLNNAVAGNPIFSITKIGATTYQVFLLSGFSSATVSVGTLITVAGTTAGTYDVVDAPVTSVTSQTDFVIDYGSDVGPALNPVNIGASVSTSVDEQAVGIGRVPNDGGGDTAGEYILDINGKARGESFMSTSDRTFKSNIETISASEGLALVEKLRPVRHDWRVDEFPDRKFSKDKQIGFIAQEVRELVPEVVSGKEGGMAVDYPKLVSVLTAAVQDLSSQVKDLKARLDAKE